MAKLTREETIVLLESAVATVRVALDGCPRRDFSARTDDYVSRIGDKMANGFAGLAIAIVELKKRDT